MKSESGKLNSEDWEKWIEETIIFSLLIPAIVVFIASLNSGMDFKSSIAVSLTVLVQALTNLYSKYKAGKTPLPVNEEIVEAVEEAKLPVSPSGESK